LRRLLSCLPKRPCKRQGLHIIITTTTATTATTWGCIHTRVDANPDAAVGANPARGGGSRWI
jgi:hypothetical protein